jgi:hypothetical protein
MLTNLTKMHPNMLVDGLQKCAMTLSGMVAHPTKPGMLPKLPVTKKRPKLASFQ